jgi:transposase
MEPTHGLPLIKRLHAESLIKVGGTEEDVIREVGCSRSTYYNYKQNIRLFGQSWAPSVSRIGRPSLFTQEMREVALLFARR